MTRIFRVHSICQNLTETGIGLNGFSAFDLLL